MTRARWTIAATSAIALAASAMGCAEIFGIHDLPDDSDAASSDDDGAAPDSDVSDAAAGREDAGVDARPPNRDGSPPHEGGTPVDAGDAGLDARVDGCISNACGGCGALSAQPGTACGTCGTYVCSADKSSVHCNDPGSTNMCPTWCTSQMPPSGVAAADYQCVDFDKGIPPAGTWAQAQTHSATFALSTASAVSSPNSLLAMAPAAADSTSAGAATLSWTDVGSKPITAITVSAQINPKMLEGVSSSWGGAYQVLCAKFNGSDSSACLEYTVDSSNKPALQIEYSYTNGAAVAGKCPITGSWTANVWNAAELSVAQSTGTVVATVNGTATMCTSTLNPSPDTSATVAIGLAASAPTGLAWSNYCDNVIAYVNR
jgi:hypothetical protein